MLMISLLLAYFLKCKASRGAGETLRHKPPPELCAMLASFRIKPIDMFKSGFLLIAIAVVFSSPASAGAADFLPESRYAADAPRFADVLGYQAGDRISSPAKVRAWFD